MPRTSKLVVALLAALPWLAYAGSELSYQYNGKDYAGQDLPASVRTQLYELDAKMNEQRQQIVDQYVLDIYLRDKAKTQGKAPEALATELLSIPEPDDKALRQFYDENWERIQKPYDEVKSSLVEVVWQKMQQDKMKELLKQIATETGYKVNLPVQDAPNFAINAAGFPSKGNPDATVTVVEFADFQCPHCKQAADAVRTVAESHGKQAKFVYRHMPINPSGISRKLAEASVCADQQGKFWEYHDLAFAKQRDLNKDSALQLATELKLDEAKFKTCLEDPKTAEAVNASEAEARSLGVTGTPSFFINGKPFQPKTDFAKDLAAAIELVGLAATPK